MNKKDKLEIYSQIINGYHDLLNLMNNITEDNYQDRILSRCNKSWIENRFLCIFIL